MSDMRVLGRVARLHYENGLTHQEIAHLFDLSRVKVTRLLAEARQQGIVEITVHTDERPFFEVEQALAKKFGLRGVWVSPPLDSDPSVLGVSGAEAMRQFLPRSRRVVIGLSEAVSASARLLGQLPVSNLELFPLAGGRAGRTKGSNPQELVNMVATSTGGVGFQLPAPLIAADARVYESLMKNSGCEEVLAAAAEADLLVVGIGTTRRVAPVLKQQVIDSDLAMISESEAVGDISARFFDAHGVPIHDGLDARVMGLSLEQMRGIGDRLAIAGGAEKIDAVRAAVSSGLVNILATDLTCAQGLLASE